MSKLTSAPQPSAAVRAVFRKLSQRGYAVSVTATLALVATAAASASAPSLLTETTAYSSADEAAKAAEAAAMPLSRVYEFGGVIVERNGRFFYTTPTTSGRTGEVKIRALIPVGARLAGLYHTHPGDSCGEFFSTEDVSTAMQMKLPSYIGVLSDGSVRRFVPGQAYPATANICHGASAGEVIT